MFKGPHISLETINLTVNQPSPPEKKTATKENKVCSYQDMGPFL